MANNEMTIKIAAQTDDFIKNIDSAKTKVRSLSMQMAEIDKQLKTESVDRVQKLSEKLELAKRAAAAAAEEANLYGNSVKKLTDKHEDLNKLTDKQKESLLKYSELMATAQQKANTYTAEVDKLQREYDEATKSTNDAEKATEDLSDAMNDAEKSTEDLSENVDKGSSKLGQFIDKLKQISLTDLAKKGLSKIAGFFADIASKAWEAAKAAAAFAKDYAKNAVEMAASYEDALGYSEQVFKNYAVQVQKWVEDNSLSLRVGETDLIQYMNKFGALFTAFGFSAEEAAEKAKSMVQLAVDLRAATGDDLPQIIQTLTSGLTGGYKAFQRYGVVVNEARLQAVAIANDLVTVNVNQLEVEKATIKVTEANRKAAEALQKYGEDSIEYQKAQIAVTEAENALTEALGGKELALTQVQKQEALAIILGEDLASVDGQAARESESYSSQLALKDTLLENLQRRIGEKLLPVFTDFITKANEFMQSDAGKEVMDALTDAVGMLADKVMELLQDEKMSEWISNLKEKVPEVTQNFLEFTDKISDLIPKIGDLVDKLLALFGIETEAEKSRQAIFEHRKEIDELAKSYDTSTDTIIKAIATFAEQNGIEMSTVVNDMEQYAPEIEGYLEGIKGSYQSATGDMWITLDEFAMNNKTTVQDICNDWETWEPRINDYVSNLGPNYETAFNDALGSFRNFANENDMELGQVLSDWQNHNIDTVIAYNEYVANTASMEDAVIQEISRLGPDSQAAIDAAVNSVNTGAWDSLWRGIKQTASDVWSFIKTVTNPSAWENSGFSLSGGVRASGGAVRAGQMYRVNDDAGRRMEMFVPNVDGYILNGNDTQRVINNSTNNSRTYGDLIVNVNSYGSDAASIADEIGAALNQKLRMAGTW